MIEMSRAEWNSIELWRRGRVDARGRSVVYLDGRFVDVQII